MEFKEIQVNSTNEIIRVVTQNKQNRIQHEDGKSQENVHESNLDEKLSCLVEGSTSIITQRANAIATENLKIEFQRLKFCWIVNPNKHLP